MEWGYALREAPASEETALEDTASKDTASKDADGLTFDVDLPSDSPWFDGHFPGAPILPGIAQLSMAADAAGRMIGVAGRVSAIRRARFRQVIRPGDRVRVSVVRREAGAGQWLFKVWANEEIACSGTLSIRIASINGRIASMSADKDPINLRVAEVMINEIKLEDVTAETFDPDLDLVDEVGIDSMDLATVALVLQDEYGIRIDEDDYPKLTTIRKIGDYIRGRLAA